MDQMDVKRILAVMILLILLVPVAMEIYEPLSPLISPNRSPTVHDDGIQSSPEDEECFRNCKNSCLSPPYTRPLSELCYNLCASKNASLTWLLEKHGDS